MSKCCFTFLKNCLRKIGQLVRSQIISINDRSFSFHSFTSSSNPCALSTQRSLTLVCVFPPNMHHLITGEILHGFVIDHQLFYAVSKWVIRDLVKVILTESNHLPKKAAGTFISNTALRNR